MFLFRLFEIALFYLVGRFFIAGRTREQAIKKVRLLKAKGFGITLNLLGEHFKKKADVEKALQECIGLIETMTREKLWGSIAVKPSQLGLEISTCYFHENLKKVLDHARTYGIAVEVDMEHAKWIDPVLFVFSSFAHDLSYRGFLRLAVQANFQEVEIFLDHYNLWGAPIRLVKGTAYHGAEYIEDEEEIRKRYVRFANRALGHGAAPFFATVRDRVLINDLEEKALLSLRSRHSFEIQMLYGLGKDLQNDLLAKGYSVRIYIPYGTNWISYGVRRLQFLLWLLFQHPKEFFVQQRRAST